jgi:glutathione synthase/RimK-type ligase-like ATP-grasp enzyme
MKEYVLFLTDFAYRLPQKRTWRESFDLAKIFEVLRKHEIFPIVTHYEDPNLFETIRHLRISNIVPATSWKIGYRNLVNNKLIALSKMGVNLIPNLDLMLAYENKCLQSDIGKVLGLDTPQSFAISTVDQLCRVSSDLGFPYVIKTSEGYASGGVTLVSNEEQQETVIREHFPEKAGGTSGIGNLLIQQYIPDLQGDWKVIVVHNTAAVLYRRVRNNDFRASGSGLFEFAEPDDELLNFAVKSLNKLGAPWVSLDIALKDGSYYVIEYQATHFGTITTDRAKFHYVHNEANQWEKRDGPVPMEDLMAKAIMEKIKLP